MLRNLITMFLFLFPFVSFSVDYPIQPKKLKTEKWGEMRERVEYLENAVYELQRKVFALQGGDPYVNPRAWFCEMKVFNERFKAFGPTKLETRENVLDQCKKKRNEFSCTQGPGIDLKCQPNE